MRRILFHILCAAFLLFVAGLSLGAQSFSMGVWQGAKGVGMSAHVPREAGYFDSFALALDFEGVVFEQTPNPGVRFTYSHNLQSRHFQTSQTKDLCFYYGPGFMAGFVSNVVSDGLAFGMAFCACAVGGLKAVFDRNVEMSLEWSMDLGVHVARGEKLGVWNSGLYMPGLTRAYLPQIKLHYIF